MPYCSQPNCRVAETGVCLDGHKQGCPHQLPEKPGEKGKPATTGGKTGSENVTFHSGEKLKPTEASKLLHERRARVVFCAGSRESGKTTLVARLGEMFRAGKFPEFRFAGSLTLCAFERASWWATITSGSGRPKTPRTSRAEIDTFYHLRTGRQDTPRVHSDILISDLPGETFPTAVGSQEFCAGLCSLGRADHLAVLLDCARLVHHADRHAEADNARTFLQRVAAVRQQNLKSLRVQVVFSRWDYVTHHGKRTEQEAHCEGLQSNLTQRFGSTFASMDFRRIAARPGEGEKPTDKEMQALFTYWHDAPLHAPANPVTRVARPARDFSAFGIV
jgi:hypothetical protein